MSELRLNPATKEWVIISSERAHRPDHTVKTLESLAPDEKVKCPFCPGHEQMTPAEILSYRSYGTQDNSPGWWIRIIPNKFAALMPGKGSARSKIEDFYLFMKGIGEHEVIIESPEHELGIATMDQKQVEEIFLAYRDRYAALCQCEKHEIVIVFKNHGIHAGTSIQHPHSQIIAAPITPMHIRHQIEEAMRFYDDQGRCVYCVMAEKEQRMQERVVMDSESFLVVEPFASRYPYETWVLPKKHDSSFDNISKESCKELAFVMRNTLVKIYRALDNPDYNYVIFSSPCHERNREYYHWHIQIIPRIGSVAGFELGSGIYINTVVPETAAQLLRETPV